MIRRISADMLLLFALLAILSAASLRFALQSKPAADEREPRRSAASPLPGGWKGLYLLLQERGAHVSRVERAPADWPADAAVMISAESLNIPSLMTGGGGAWTEKEVESARQWLKEGRTLVVFSGRKNPLLDAMGLPVAEIGTRDDTMFPLQPAPFLAGVSGITVPGRGRFRETPRDAVMLLAGSDPAAVVLRRGGGTLIALSDAGLADNAHLTRADNARFLTALIESYAGSGGRIAFDEYHQGYQREDSFWDAVGPAGRWAAWQIALLMALIAWSASRRFGLPRPLPEPSRVSSEYVSSLADLYRRAHAGDAAIESIYQAFRRDLCRAVSLPSDAPDDEVVAHSAHLLGTEDVARGGQRLTSLMQQCRHAIDSGKVPERDLVPLVREMETLRKELRLGGDDGTSSRR